jgi:hypothetical protein
VKWEKDSVAEVLLDTTNILTASGLGFWDIPEALKDLLLKNHVSINVQVRDRKPGDR